MPRFQLIVPRGEPLGAPSHRAVRPLAFWHLVFRLGDPASSPLPCLGPLLLGDLPLEVGEGPWESFVSAWPPCRFFGPLIRLFVAGDAFVGRAPANLYRDIWPSPSQCRDVLPCLDGVLLPWTRFVRCHPPDGCLRVGEDGDSFRGRVPLRGGGGGGGQSKRGDETVTAY